MGYRYSPYRAALFIVMPLAVLLVGIGIVATAPWRPADLRFLMLPVACAALGPVLAAFALQIVAPGFDRVLVAAAGVLLGIGLTFQAVLATSAAGVDEFFVATLTRQGYFIGGGFLVLAAGAWSARWVGYLRRIPLTLLTGALVLTTTTALFGSEINGARLWLDIGPIQFQPSEIGRLLIAGFVAVYLHERRHLIGGSWLLGGLTLPPLPYLVPLGIAVAVALAALFFQNDLGMASLIALSVVAIVLGAGGNRWMTVLTLASVGVAAVASYLAVGRVRDRVVGWINPWNDPAGRGFQFIQSEFAVAGGGVAGRLGDDNAQNIPEVHTDFVLAGIGGEFGIVIAVAVLAVTGLLLCRCILAGLRTDDGLEALFALSIAALMGIQVLLIAGGTLRVLPLTGLTFPLVSYGGTSMLVTMLALGIVVGIGARARRKEGVG